VFVTEDEDAPALAPHRDDVARVQLLDGLLHPARAAAIASEGLHVGAQLAVAQQLVEVGAGELALAGEHGAVAFQLPFELHDVAIRVELRERQVEQVVRLELGVAAHQVGGHVVGGSEAGADRVGAA
jgi:hypothetical protein